MKHYIFLSFAFSILLTACDSIPSSVAEQPDSSVQQSAESSDHTYQQITQDEAKELMQADNDSVIVDVRRQDEYDSGHIPGAILIPNESISTERPKALPDLNQIILIYCRSGRRSKEASQKLADMGYTNIYEFGGIIDWNGETTVYAGA